MASTAAPPTLPERPPASSTDAPSSQPQPQPQPQPQRQPPPPQSQQQQQQQQQRGGFSSFVNSVRGWNPFAESTPAAAAPATAASTAPASTAASAAAPASATAQSAPSAQSAPTSTKFVPTPAAHAEKPAAAAAAEQPAAPGTTRARRTCPCERTRSSEHDGLCARARACVNAPPIDTTPSRAKPPNTDFYDVLGVPWTATTAEIKKVGPAAGGPGLRTRATVADIRAPARAGAGRATTAPR